MAYQSTTRNVLLMPRLPESGCIWLRASFDFVCH